MVANPSWDPNGAWTNVLDEEFPGSSLSSTWQPTWFKGASSSNSGPINSNEGQGYDSANVTVSGGNLNLALTASRGAVVSSNPGNGAGATGFTVTPPAAFEARCFLPASPHPADNGGIDNWPAWWLDTTGSWPAGVEVDIVEGLNGFASYHIHDNSGGPGGNAGSVSTYAGAFHTYGCNWQSNGVIQFYYDGVLVGTETTVNHSPGPHYLVFDYSSSGPPDAGLTMLVDWCRVWTPGGQGGSGSGQTGMQVTATSSGPGVANGIELTVTVWNGAAATQSGATVDSVTTTLPQLAITPVSSNSLIFGSVVSGLATKYTGLANSTFTQNAVDAANVITYGTFQSAAPTVAGVAGTYGAQLPSGSSGQFWISLAEIQAAAGKTLTLDSSTPAPLFASGAETVTTAGFNPPGGALIIAQVVADNGPVGNVNIAVSDNTGLTWTQLVNSGGVDLASVWIAGAATGSPVTGGNPSTRNLIVSIAPQAGTDPYNNPFPQGVMVGPVNQPQVALLPSPGGGAAKVSFPMPIGLSNVPNLAGGQTSTYANLLLSGPAMNVANDMDWVQVVLFSNQSGTAANGQLRYISNAGAATVVLQWDSGGLFIPTVGSAPATPSGGVRLYYRAGALRAKGPSGNEITIATT